jgi:uncharacterized protein with GYD domain
LRACILVQVERGKGQGLLKWLDARDVKAFAAFGGADIVVRAEVDGFAQLQELVQQLDAMGGVRSSETLAEMAVPAEEGA